MMDFNYLLKKRPDLSKDEKYVEEIVDAYLATDVKKLLTPSNEVLILDEINSVHISLRDSEVEISNHNFLYRKTFRLKFVEELQKKVRDVVKVEREQLRKTLFKNELDLLQKIKENIKG